MVLLDLIIQLLKGASCCLCFSDISVTVRACGELSRAVTKPARHRERSGEAGGPVSVNG